MTALNVDPTPPPVASPSAIASYQPRPVPAWRKNLALALRNPRIVIGGLLLAAIVLPCLLSLPWTLHEDSNLFYDGQYMNPSRAKPAASEIAMWFGTDVKGRSILGRCLLGGVTSLAVGFAAAIISVFLGVGIGMLAGFRGGWLDAVLMRIVDVLYGLPYILMVILLKMALDGSAPLRDGWWTSILTAVLGALLIVVTLLARSSDAAVGDPKRVYVKTSLISAGLAMIVLGWAFLVPMAPLTMGQTNIAVLFLAIGLVSWLTMARVIRGQVLSLRGQPFVEAARAMGIRESRIFLRHILPNLVGPITVYTTLTIPQAILQESFLSFLGLGVLPPTPSWGGLASENRVPGLDLDNPKWWMLAFPCILLALTLLSLNFLGDGLRDLFDPKREAAKL
jgi:oligopeptide transport system permease protein